MVESKGLSLTATPALKQLLTKAADDPSVSLDIRSQATALAQEDQVSWKRLRPIYMAVRDSKQSESGSLLRDACSDSKLILPGAPQKPARSPELVARLEALQRKEEERQYKAMVHDVTGVERKAEEIREGGLVSYKDQLSYGLHILVVMGVFYGLGHLAASRISSTLSVKAAGGLCGLVFGMLMESVLLIIHTARAAKKAEREERRPQLRNQQRAKRQPVNGSLHPVQTDPPSTEGPSQKGSPSTEEPKKEK